ncbi:YkvA family protein [Hydrogenophaga sp. 5NK40-0174]|uniref:YkvA family protein n=1 Tax=Hydrogenophaga sp. 5NK40-0174 TaxID=3127649 RepID=UPI00310507FD
MWKRLAAIWMALRGDVKRVWYAMGHPHTPRWFKLGVLGVLVYLVSPIDVIPDFLPLFGIMDDLVLAPLALRWLLARLPEHVQRHAEQGGRPVGAKVRSGR